MTPIQRFKQAAASLMLAAVVILSLALPLAGCRDAGSGPPTSAAPARPADHVYTSRGEVAMLPGTSPTATLQIHHEPIDDFVNPDGHKGMASMTMPMLMAPGVSLEGLAVGDKVEFDMAVWHRPGTTTVETFRVTRVRKLPPDTTLRFGAATPTLGG
jgi:Cu/Ag efflux protein CusF